MSGEQAVGFLIEETYLANLSKKLGREEMGNFYFSINLLHTDPANSAGPVIQIVGRQRKQHDEALY
jgi:hypothetical protein